MESSVNVAVIGGGQAGLATSWYLTQAKVDHVVLESGGVAETWRSRRWDSFCLVTPSAVPGLYFMGVHWMRKNKSSILYGVGEDAEVVSRHIVESRK